jgi:hypothetical protein
MKQLPEKHQQFDKDILTEFIDFERMYMLSLRWWKLYLYILLEKKSLIYRSCTNYKIRGMGAVYNILEWDKNMCALFNSTFSIETLCY